MMFRIWNIRHLVGVITVCLYAALANECMGWEKWSTDESSFLQTSFQHLAAAERQAQNLDWNSNSTGTLLFNRWTTPLWNSNRTGASRDERQVPTADLNTSFAIKWTPAEPDSLIQAQEFGTKNSPAPPPAPLPPGRRKTFNR